MSQRTLEDMDTPALIVDAGICAANLKRMAAYVGAHDLQLRPHTKTHKSLELAGFQMQQGASGLTVAKVGEAEVMQAACNDLLLAYPVVDGRKARRLAELARSRTVRVAVDSSRAIEVLAEAATSAQTHLGILVDLDVGFHRTGVPTPQAALALAQQAARASSLRLDGLFCYPGHVHAPTSQQAPFLAEVQQRLVETLELWRAHGLEAGIVSGGSTPSAYQSHLMPAITEIRPGTYIFNDMNSVAGGFCALDDCAATLLCTVISDAVPGKVVIDAGSKTLSSDRNGIKPDSGHGHVVGYPQAKIVRLSEEHGEIDLSVSDRRPRLGERLQVIPNHICPCVNLQDTIWLNQAGQLRPLRVDARGKLT